MAVRDQEVRNDGFERAILERRVTLRRGVITDVHLQGHRVPWPCFETTIPVEGGMSGGPVLWYGDAGAPMVACGMLSRDFSPDEAKSSYKVAGCSTAAMLWPSLGLAVHVEAKAGGAPERVFLLELIKRGVVEELGSAATEALVTTERDGRVTISRTSQ